MRLYTAGKRVIGLVFRNCTYFRSRCTATGRQRENTLRRDGSRAGEAIIQLPSGQNSVPRRCRIGNRADRLHFNQPHRSGRGCNRQEPRLRRATLAAGYDRNQETRTRHPQSRERACTETLQRLCVTLEPCSRIHSWRVPEA